jgi:hypothetical protein
MNWVDLFYSSSKINQTEHVVLNKCKGHYIICDITTPCFVDTQNDYCNQHKDRYRFNKPEECPVCYETTSDIPIPLECGHWVHRECMSKSKKPVCPICRKTIHLEDILYFMGKKYKEKMDKIELVSAGTSSMNQEQPTSVLELFSDTNNRATFVRFVEIIISTINISTINPIHIELVDTLRNIINSSQTMNPMDLFRHRLNIMTTLPTELFDQFNWEATFLTNINNNTILNRYNNRIHSDTRNIRNQRNIDNTHE